MMAIVLSVSVAGLRDVWESPETTGVVGRSRRLQSDEKIAAALQVAVESDIVR